MKRRSLETVNNVCLLCARDVSNDSEVTKRKIFEYPDWINLVVEIVGFELCHDRSLPDTVCNACIALLIQYLEFRREIFNNVIKHHINYYILKNDFTKAELYRGKIRHSHCNNEQRIDPIHDTKQTENNLIITDVRSERLLDQSNLLEPMFQTSENALETESGGKIHAMNDEITARREIHQEYKCQFCDKIYNKEHFYRKHLRKHKNRKSGRKVEKRQFLCNELNCGKLFDRLIELRKHTTVHGSKFKCSCCTEEFSLWYDYQWHYQVCDATQRGRLENGVTHRTRSKLSKSVISQFSDGSLSNAEGDDNDSEASIVPTISDYQDKKRFRKLQAYKIRQKCRREKKLPELQGQQCFPDHHINKKVTFGILCRLDSEGKNTPIRKEENVVGYTTKELIQNGVNRLRDQKKINAVDIDPYRQPKNDWQLECDYKLIDLKPTTYASSTDNIEDLQVPIDSFFTKPSSPIMFYKEEQHDYDKSVDIPSQRLSPLTKLQAFSVFEMEPVDFCNSDVEPLASRTRPDSTVNYLPSFDDLFPKNHLCFDELHSIFLKWS